MSQIITDSHQTLDWGITCYEDAFEKQTALVEARKCIQVPDTLILTEHQPVFTLGKRKETKHHIIWDEKEREQQGVQMVETNRGGDVTYHGPGQLVGYPIIDLKQQKDLHRYLRNLEQVIINALGCLGLASHRRTGLTGIWLEHRKIAAIGVAVSQWVTYHGFAININNDLTPFQGIVPCGIGPLEGTVTSLEKELGYSMDMKEVKSIISVEFWNIFK